MRFEVVFDPLFAWPLIAALAAALCLLLAWAARRGLVGWPFRIAAGVLLAAALVNPSLRTADRIYEPDLALLLTDRTSSQSLGERSQQLETALAAVREQIAAFDGVEIVEAAVEDALPGSDAGTLLMTELRSRMPGLDAGRLAGVIIVSDGQIHDHRLAPPVPAPAHILISGARSERDREVVALDLPAFGVVGEHLDFRVGVLDHGSGFDRDATAVIKVSVEGGETQSVTARPGEFKPLRLKIGQAGAIDLRFETPPAAGELTTYNNVLTQTLHGVRDSLNVLLVSGFPHPGQRSWRNVLKSDGSVDLIHFTILRSTGNRDSALPHELALAPFPVQELFVEKLDSFDVVIFDRYLRRGLIPLVHYHYLQNYVEQGGALLIAAGPEFAMPGSLAETAIGQLLPAVPTGEVHENGFFPRVTEVGSRHPVTATLLDGSELTDPDVPGLWGRWFRQVGFEPKRGEVVMSGDQNLPLLFLDRVGKGRIALLASDQAWLWQRGVEGGGPLPELLRRVLHWLMKEPELEEETLTLTGNGDNLQVTRRTLSDEGRRFGIRGPDGVQFDLEASRIAPGVFAATLPDPQIGNWAAMDGALTANTFVGPATPKEFQETIATAQRLNPLAAVTGGGVFWLEDGVPDIRRVSSGRAAYGKQWLGLEKREFYRTASLSKHPLLPPLLAAALVILLAAAAWRREGR